MEGGSVDWSCDAHHEDRRQAGEAAVPGGTAAATQGPSRALEDKSGGVGGGRTRSGGGHGRRPCPGLEWYGASFVHRLRYASKAARGTASEPA